MANKHLNNAKIVKNDEFYTQYADIQKEIEAYLEYNPDTFRGKVVYCNCDDPFESNFFRYFALNFNKLGLKQLITTNYKPKVITYKFIINEVKDIDGDGEFNLKDIAKQLKANKNNEWTPLEEDGDFRSDECIELLKQVDIVVTNPPFSLFREYVKQLVDYDKKFLIIGNMNAITYKGIFPLIKENKMWLGNGFRAGNAYFFTPVTRKFANGVYDDKTGLVKFGNCRWFTNLNHGRRHQKLELMTMADNKRFNKKVQKSESCYQKYDNYDAIEVSFTDAIPSDYEGAMGVPISFLDKYNPDQFEIIGMVGKGFSGNIWNGKKPYYCVINGRNIFKRMFIKHKKK